jgi:hypothetical protein
MNNVVRLPAVRRPGPIASNGVVGMLLFVVAEAMFFAGLVSAFTIVKTTALTEWPPAGQPRLPIERTAFNTVALVASGAVLWMADRRFAKSEALALRLLLVAAGLGAFFVVFQGVEWAALVADGLSVRSSTHGGFFCLIVGARGARRGRPRRALRRGETPPERNALASLFLDGSGLLVLRRGDVAPPLLEGLPVTRKRSQVVVLAFTVLTWAGAAAACPVCFAAKGEENRKAFVRTAVFMSALPLLMIGGFVWWAAHRVRRHELGSANDANAPSPVNERSPSRRVRLDSERSANP